MIKYIKVDYVECAAEAIIPLTDDVSIYMYLNDDREVFEIIRNNTSEEITRECYERLKKQMLSENNFKLPLGS